LSYEKITVKAAIQGIDENKMFLPALQRRFVWKKAQIQLLFDSLMRDYPIGTFLFWKLTKKKASDYVFYEFLKDFDEREPFNKRKEGVFLNDPIGVLDGQQRLSSIYIGLMGTHTEREAYKWASNPDAFQKTRMYLNLLSLPYFVNSDGKLELSEKHFEFKFLTESEKNLKARTRIIEDEEGKRQQVEEPVFWFKVGQILDWDTELNREDLFEEMLSQAKGNQVSALEQNKRAILRCLCVIDKRFNKDDNINFFNIAKEELEEILQIFVRVNSGGTVLTKSDLLFSTIAATWKEGREKIEDLQANVNQKGDGFNFGIEYFMRCCLMLLDLPIAYKVNSFKAANVETISQNWDKIADSIKKTVDLLTDFGFNSSLLASQNSTLIIAYYIFKGGALAESSKNDIRKYLVHAMLKNIYGSSQEALLSRLREAIQTEHKLRFDFAKLVQTDLPNRKTLSISNTDLDEFLTYKKGSQAFLVLTLLYPNLRYLQTQFHQDHIHPLARFSASQFKELGLSSEEAKVWLDKRDCVPNLQFLEGRENKSKNDTPIQVWMNGLDESNRRSFISSNYFPINESFEFHNFARFYEARKDILREALKGVLFVSDDNSSVIEFSDEE
jgi:uncharacterized protein with ParB-like and HNH nuclease domain